MSLLLAQTEQLVYPLQFYLECQCVFLCNIDDLTDYKLHIGDQLRGIEGLADDLQHVDVGEGLQ